MRLGRDWMLRILRPENAGNYYFAVVIVGWFEILMNFGLNTFLSREVARDRSGANRYLVNTSILRLLLASATLPRLFGRSTQTWQVKPMPRWRLRPWSSASAMPKCNWMSGTSRSGRVFRKPPHSAKFEVIGPRRSRRYWPMARNRRGKAPIEMPLKFGLSDM